MFRSLILFIAILLCIGAPVQGYASSSAAEAEKFVSNIVNVTISIIKSDKLSARAKEDRLSQLFVDKVDVEWISRFVLGRYWRDATAQQRVEYHKVYKQFLLMSYVPRFREYTGEKVQIRGVRIEDADEYTVESRIISASIAQPIRVDYKLRYKNGHYQIYDIIAEGVSMIGVQRAEFGSILARNGIDSLLDALKRKVQS